MMVTACIQWIYNIDTNASPQPPIHHHCLIPFNSIIPKEEEEGEAPLLQQLTCNASNLQYLTKTFTFQIFFLFLCKCLPPTLVLTFHTNCPNTSSYAPDTIQPLPFLRLLPTFQHWLALFINLLILLMRCILNLYNSQFTILKK